MGHEPVSEYFLERKKIATKKTNFGKFRSFHDQFS